jgi:hypothetical protein
VSGLRSLFYFGVRCLFFAWDPWFSLVNVFWDVILGQWFWDGGSTFSWNTRHTVYQTKQCHIMEYC